MSKPGTNTVSLEIKDNVGIITLDHFPVNTLSNAVMLGLEAAANEVAQKQDIQAVVVRGAGERAFCAGADVTDLNKKHEKYPKESTDEVLEKLNVPVVALLHGFALGGGLETALGCHYRISTPNAAVGLPEVNIGLLPGGHGTQRLPRIVGAEAALDIMLTGKHVPASAAKAMGVIDEIIPAEQASSAENRLEFAIQFAKSKIGSDLKPRKSSLLSAPNVSDDKFFDKIAQTMLKKRRKEVAPLAIINCVKFACSGKSYKEGIAFERDEFQKVLQSKEAAGLQGAFFGERAAAKVPGLKAKPLKIGKVGVLGAGTMGGGIAMCFANIGIKVLLLDREDKFLERGLSVIKGNYARSVKRKSISQAKMDKAMSMFSTTTKYEDLGDCDMIIEAVFEDINLKKEVFQKLAKCCKPGAILASNTSYLNIDAMAEATGDMERMKKVVGMHFFSPANVMKLLENIRGKYTDDSTLATVMSIGQKIGKFPALVNNRDGFVANRMMASYSKESKSLVYSGVSFAEVDKVAIDFGMPMGPFMMHDLVGLDLGYQAREKSGDIHPDTDITDALIGAGRLGMKNGKGYYEYEGRKRTPSTISQELLERVRKNRGGKTLSLTPTQITERLFFPIINEGFKILEERVADKPSDVDMLLIHGYNWPRVTGGPMLYADVFVGLPKILSALDAMAKEFPDADYFKASKLLRDVVASGEPLSKFWAKNAHNYKFISTSAAKL